MAKDKIAKDKKQKKNAEDCNQNRTWDFTDWSKSDATPIYLKYKDIIRYMCWGLEEGNKTGKEHHQGCIQFYNKKTKGGVLRIMKQINKDISIRPLWAEEVNLQNYVKKDNKIQEFGELMHQGHRTDLENIKKLLDNETPMKKIADDYFQTWCNNHNAFKKYEQMVAKEKRATFRHVEVEVIEGLTGQGKTKEAMKTENIYKIEGDSLDWWDGYEGEKTILIDEYNNQLPITKLLNILDGYQLRLAVKGGFTYANWTKVFVTTNKVWDEWHQNAANVHRDALKRRITKWTKLAKEGPISNTSLGPSEQVSNILDSDF